MLDTESFKKLVENAPLVSIDLCLVCNGQLLLGKRNNEPLKGHWFTPGGRILKNEPWADCLRRVARSELGLEIRSPENFSLMGIWDHFYNNSAVSEIVSTHYVNLPLYMRMEKKPNLLLDPQHDELCWFDLEEVVNSNGFHEYMRNYALWILKEDFESD
jgi:colanic acid biosynthesis protein WcaH